MEQEPDTNNEPADDNAFETQNPIDRGIPSIAAKAGSHKASAAALLGLAALAMAYVVIDGQKKAAPPSLVEAEEIVFRSPSASSFPYIEPAAGEEEQKQLENPPAQAVPSEAEKALAAEAIRIARAQEQLRQERIRSPQLVYDAPAAMQTAAGAQSTLKTSQADQIKDLSLTVPQGTMISGVLETAIQSDLPGMVRAIISENIYSFDSTELLIPKGTALIGQYKSGITRGQSRVFIIWNRLIRPDGISLTLDSNGTDTLGRTGLEGDVDTHFFERFGSSMLLSLIDAGLQAGVRAADNTETATVALSTGKDFSRASEIALENTIAIPPTININQGTRINVFVGQDLLFPPNGRWN